MDEEIGELKDQFMQSLVIIGELKNSLLEMTEKIRILKITLARRKKTIMFADTPQREQLAHEQEASTKSSMADRVIEIFHLVNNVLEDSTAGASINMIRDMRSRDEGWDWFRMFKKMLLFLMAPPAEGRTGFSNKEASELKRLLKISTRNKMFEEVMKLRAAFKKCCDNDGDSMGAGIVEALYDYLLGRIFNRDIRSDALSTRDIALIQRWWDDCTEVSPNQNDCVKKRDSRSGNIIEKHQVHYSYVRVIDVAQHGLKTYNIKFSIATVLEHKPFYVRKGQKNTCVCIRCENMMSMIKAVKSNIKLLDRETYYIKASITIRRVMNSWIAFLRVFKYDANTKSWNSKPDDEKRIPGQKDGYLEHEGNYFAEEEQKKNLLAFLNKISATRFVSNGILFRFRYKY